MSFQFFFYFFVFFFLLFVRFLSSFSFIIELVIVWRRNDRGLALVLCSNELMTIMKVYFNLRFTINLDSLDVVSIVLTDRDWNWIDVRTIYSWYLRRIEFTFEIPFVILFRWIHESNKKRRRSTRDISIRILSLFIIRPNL